MRPCPSSWAGEVKFPMGRVGSSNMRTSCIFLDMGDSKFRNQESKKMARGSENRSKDRG